LGQRPIVPSGQFQGASEIAARMLGDTLFAPERPVKATPTRLGAESASTHDGDRRMISWNGILEHP
jgi:hypothetical protein